MTYIINLFGGPGSGKSTVAAGIFYNLKKQHIDCELVSEYAKSRVWEGSIATLEDQLYVFAKQNHSQRRLLNKTQFVITDSPILLSSIYNNSYNNNFNKLVLEIFMEYKNINYFINRGTFYDTNGRLQSLSNACELDNKIVSLLESNGIPIMFFDQNETVANEITSDIIKYTWL